ncbi:alpha beta-hydrolase, partial [Rhizoctonia solani]
MWNQLTIASAALWGLTVSFALSIPAVKATYTPSIHSRQSSNASTISWSACPDSSNTQCAIFEVPMDYTNPENGKTVSIFMRKYAATAPEDQRLGSILVNPGGPGGSGTASVAVQGEDLSTMVDGRYDIIGFDPRGVNLTGPPTACHDTEYKFAQRMYQFTAQGAPFPHIGGAGEIAHVAKLSAIQSSHPKACTENGNHDMLTNSGTVAVAKDMERIVQALGEDGLNFLGYSYGSILGATFAAMRPHLVKRMVLDGVSDAEAYYNDVLEWGRTSIQDTHKTIAGFVSTCIEAGPTECALAARKDNKTETVEGLTKRIDALYTKLGKEPLVVGDSVTGPGIIQANIVQSTVFAFAYFPVLWKQLAAGLALLEQGDGRDFYPALNSFIYGVVPEPYTQVELLLPSLEGTRETQYPVLCGDSPRVNITVEEYTDYFREMGKNNSTGEPLALIVGGCRDWPFRATERYTGPWSVEKGLNKTRFPILLVSMDADPVTPLPSALKMNRAFGSESSTLLIQHGFGHPSYSHPSLCTVKNVHDYFVNGIVPKNGTRCTSEPGYIYPTNSTRSKRSALSKRDAKLLEAVERLGLRRAGSGMIPGI